MRILGVDPGYERLGIAIVERLQKNKETLIYSSCFRTSSKDDFKDRLHQVGREIERVIKEYGPESLAIETLFFSKNQKTALKVAEVRGVIQYQAKRQDLSIYEYSPSDIKIAVTSSGNSSKEQIIAMIPRLIKIEKTDGLDDEYDAIAVALTHFAHHRV